METFITHDCAVVSVPVEFLKKRMNNGVVPRLLGWAMEDGLTTHEPSRNKDGHLTVLQDMHIVKRDFVMLLQFLRLGHLPYNLQQVYEASLCLGGFDALDAFMRDAHKAPPPSVATYNPMTPKEDTRREYTWTIRHMNIDRELQGLQDTGWSVTDPVRDSAVHVYLRRKAVAQDE